jgi:ABC-type spermidine/putrescine transport system permease subunit I
VARSGGELKRGLFLGAPGVVCLIALLVLPLANGDFTLDNYTALLSPAYGLYFYDTFRIGLIACAVAMVFAYPVAYRIAMERRARQRRALLGFFIAMMFLSVLARVYSIALTFGPVGLARRIASVLGIAANGYSMAEILVVMGLVHLTLPIATLTLIGSLQNINPRLVEAAQALGSTRWHAHLSVTLPLSAPAAISGFLICFSLCTSAFVIPMVLGGGRVLFVSNLIYNRFSEIADFPGGAAIAVILLVITLLVVSTMTALANRVRKSV